MRFPLFGLLVGLVSLPLFAANPVSFTNDREGETFYSSGSDRRAMNRALRQVHETHINDAFEETLRGLGPAKLCSFDLNAALLANLRKVKPDFSELTGAIIYLRTKNQFDDSVTKLLLAAEKIAAPGTPLKDPEALLAPHYRASEEALKVLANFEKKAQGQCFDEAYRTLYGDILKFDRHLKSHHVEAIFHQAQSQGVISRELYARLEKARANELEAGTLTLRSYHRKIQSLRTQFPLRDKTERSAFVTQKLDKVKLSRRQRLLESYTDVQIILMADVIRKLRTRIESPRAEILIFDRQNGVETIPLEPMERFRLAVKLLRKEMSLLSLNTFFQGRSPEYIDLMTAAFETGVIAGSELNEVAGLEEIWNPKKTFWEKAQVWVRLFGTVASIALPPPYGFIPALAIVVIEMTVGKKDDNNANDPTVLF
jgi:hypothetical protein